VAHARILFVGNSFTTRNAMPRLVAELAAEAQPPVGVEFDVVSAGGASLRRHWNAGLAQRAIASSRPDWVVLQEQSTLPLRNASRYHDNVRQFVPVVAAADARLALYLTWSRRGAPLAQDAITAAVEAIALEAAATIVPVGSVWHRALREAPDLALYAPDGSHPTAIGSYLAACTFLVHLVDRDPVGSSVSGRLGIDAATAARLHTFAVDSRR
jgi:hypothetical protein